MVEAYVVGLAGMALLVVGWAVQAVRTVRERRSSLSPGFEFLYFVGAVLLTVYALALGDWIFTTLNVLAASLASIGLYFHFVEPRLRGRKGVGWRRKPVERAGTQRRA